MTKAEKARRAGQAWDDLQLVLAFLSRADREEERWHRAYNTLRGSKTWRDTDTPQEAELGRRRSEAAWHQRQLRALAGLCRAGVPVSDLGAEVVRAIGTKVGKTHKAVTANLLGITPGGVDRIADRLVEETADALAKAGALEIEYRDRGEPRYWVLTPERRAMRKAEQAKDAAIHEARMERRRRLAAAVAGLQEAGCASAAVIDGYVAIDLDDAEVLARPAIAWLVEQAAEGDVPARVEPEPCGW